MTIREKVARAICATVGDHHFVDAAWDEHIDFAVAAITAFLEAAAEQGWHMRPDEPSPEMRHAAFVAMDKPHAMGEPKARAFDCVVGYRAMLDAAPEFEWDK